MIAVAFVAGITLGSLGVVLALALVRRPKHDADHRCAECRGARHG